VIDGLMVFVGGLLGSGHCVGMCGGFALLLGSNRLGLIANLWRQFVYSLGRVGTYTVGGAVAGYGGWWLGTLRAPALSAQALLGIAAGLLLIAQGLSAAGVLRWRLLTGGMGCLGPASFATLLKARPAWQVFGAGVLNGLLPCGLVYAYLALACRSRDLLDGAVTMALFGLGTVPALLLVGSSGSMLGVILRRRILRMAAWCVVLTGLLAMARGISYSHPFGPAEPAGCPLCGPSCE
jgi:sulfite exporter TauE/SafE